MRKMLPYLIFKYEMSFLRLVSYALPRTILSLFHTIWPDAKAAFCHHLVLPPLCTGGAVLCLPTTTGAIRWLNKDHWLVRDPCPTAETRSNRRLDLRSVGAAPFGAALSGAQATTAMKRDAHPPTHLPSWPRTRAVCGSSGTSWNARRRESRNRLRDSAIQRFSP